MKRALVVAKYKEDIQWTSEYKNDFDVFIYNKNHDDNGAGYINLENVGREANTYLHHIVHNYDKLADVTYFLQGDPFFHCKDLKSSLYTEVNGFSYISDTPFSEDFLHSASIFPETISTSLASSIFETIGKAPLRNVSFNAGAMFAVSREVIHQHKKPVYEELLRLSVSNPRMPWTMERLWFYVFN